MTDIDAKDPTTPIKFQGRDVTTFTREELIETIVILFEQNSHLLKIAREQPRFMKEIFMRARP